MKYKRFGIGFNGQGLSYDDFGDRAIITIGKLQIGWRK